MTETELVCVLSHRPNPDGTERTPLAVPGLLVCRGHERRTVDDLAALPDLWAELAEAHTSWQQPSGYRPASAERPLPINPAISDHRGAVVERLASWARMVAGARHVSRPETPDPYVVAGWLALHEQWTLAHEDYAADYSKAVHDLASRALALLFPRKGDIRTQLPCPLAESEECGGTLTNLGDDRTGDADDDALPEKITCDSCGYVLPASQWRTYRRQLHKRLNPGPDSPADQVLVTEDDAILWALAEGHRLTGPTLRQWATRGRVTRHLRGTRTLYDLDEIESRLTTRVVA